MKDRFPVTKLLPMLADEVAEQVREIVPDIAEAECQRKSVSVAIEKDGVNEAERSVVRYISTREVDRDGEILLPKGAMMDEYKKNPIVLFGHDYSSPPHGKAEYVKADGYGVLSKTVYAETERGEEIWQLVKGGFMNAASVGFIPVEYVDNPEKRVYHWGGGRSPKSWEDVTGRLCEEWGVKQSHFAEVKTIYTKWLLLEYSDVPVPSNGSALIQRSKELGISDDMLKSLGLEPIVPEPEAPIIEVRQVVERWCRPVKPVDVRPVRLPLDVRAMTEQAVRELVGVR